MRVRKTEREVRDPTVAPPTPVAEPPASRSTAESAVVPHLGSLVHMPPGRGSGPVAHAALLQLQRSAGNQGVQQLVVQRKWKDADQIDSWNLVRADPERALYDLAVATKSPLFDQYRGLDELLKAGGTEMVGQVRQYLKETLADGEQHPTDELLSRVIAVVTATMREKMQGTEGGPDDENDHPEEDGASPEDVAITDPSQVIPNQLGREPELREGIFRNLAAQYGFSNVSVDAFIEWSNAGVVTRSGFQDILRRHSRADTSNQGEAPMQLKRVPGAVSGPSSYMTQAYGPFVNVTYTTDMKANIDFTAPTAQTTWVNPVAPGSVVNLRTGCAVPGYGLLNNNVMTKLHKAGRSRHNMIANRVGGAALAAMAAATHTWHHRSTEYQMELVDYIVHRKHGHNGGFLFWKDGK